MKKHDLRKQSKLLVESILDKDPITANSIFQRLILEAEEEREDDVLTELGLDDAEDTSSDDTENTDDLGLDDGEGGEDTDDAEAAADLGMTDDVESMNAEETDNTVDDIVEINCQINAKLISNLFDKIAELKTQLGGLGLDESSREYLNYDVAIQYYSDKLQELQGKTNPGIDQTKVQTAIDKIEAAIQELSGKVGGGSTDDFSIDTPAEVEAEAGLGEADNETTEAETDGEENTDSETSDDELEDLFGEDEEDEEVVEDSVQIDEDGKLADLPLPSKDEMQEILS
jgi:hypothetical protein